MEPALQQRPERRGLLGWQAPDRAQRSLENDRARVEQVRLERVGIGPPAPQRDVHAHCAADRAPVLDQHVGEEGELRVSHHRERIGGARGVHLRIRREGVEPARTA